MKKRRHLSVLMMISILSAAAASLGALDLEVGRVQIPPRMDGTLQEGEYPSQIELAKMRVSVGYQGKTLYMALEGETGGWVALGLGSSRMNQADMIIGFVLRGLPTLREQKGIFHGHRDTEDMKLQAWGMTEEDDPVTTVMELQLPLDDDWLTRDGRIQTILAIGNRDNLRSMHSWYDRLVLIFQN